MKIFLSIASTLLLFSALTFQASAADRGPGKGHKKGHGKHHHKKQKHHCNAHCRAGVHHYDRVIIVQPAPRPGININLPL